MAADPTNPSAPLRIWQGTFWHGFNLEHEVTLYGETLTDLTSAVEAWFVENTPAHFSSVRPGTASSETREYAYSDGTQNIRALARRQSFEDKALDAGWYYFPPGLYARAQLLGDIAAAARHFTAGSLDIRRGPDYQNPEFVTEPNIPLHQIREVKRTADDGLANVLLNRGWFIIGTDYEGNVGHNYAIANRKTIFILGHTEEGAY